MFGRAEDVVIAGIGTVGRLAGIEQPKPHLHAQNTRNCIVDPRLGDLACFGPGKQVGVDRLPRVRGHIHVDAGHQRLRAALVGAARDLAVRIPVRHDEAAEVHPVLQHPGQQALVAGHLLALPAGEAGHHRGDSFGDGGAIGLAVDVAQLRLADRGIALIDTIVRPAVGEEMLGRGEHVGTAQEVVARRRALQSADHRADIGCDEVGVGTVALVGAAPAEIAWHGNRRGEGPFLARDADFLRGRCADPFDQGRVAHRAEADIVREDGCADDVRMAVHRVGTPDQRDADTAVAGIDRCEVERVRRLEPFRGRGKVVAAGTAVAADEDRTEIVGSHIFRRDAAQVRLDQLADFFRQGHARYQR